MLQIKTITPECYELKRSQQKYPKKYVLQNKVKQKQPITYYKVKQKQPIYLLQSKTKYYNK